MLGRVRTLQIATAKGHEKIKRRQLNKRAPASTLFKFKLYFLTRIFWWILVFNFCFFSAQDLHVSSCLWACSAQRKKTCFFFDDLLNACVVCLDISTRTRARGCAETHASCPRLGLMIRRITGNRGIYGGGSRLPALIVIWDAQLKFLPCAKELRAGEMADQRV